MSREPQLKIKMCDDGYRFFVFPPQYPDSNCIGRSAKAYQTIDECTSEMERFKTLVLENGLCKEDGKLVKIERQKIKPSYSKSFQNRYYFIYYDENGQCIFERPSGYTNRENCKNGIKAVFNAINKM